MYEVRQNFLSLYDCEMMISYYEDNKDNSYFWKPNETRPLIINHKFPWLDEKVMSWVQEMDNSDLHIRSTEIVKWNTGNKMQLHLDNVCDLWSALIYLNDDFTGGITILEDGIQIRPEIGKCLLFKGSKIKHGVTVVSGLRYTIPYWIVRQDIGHTMTIGRKTNV